MNAFPSDYFENFKFNFPSPPPYYVKNLEFECFFFLILLKTLNMNAKNLLFYYFQFPIQIMLKTLHLNDCPSQIMLKTLHLTAFPSQPVLRIECPPLQIMLKIKPASLGHFVENPEFMMEDFYSKASLEYNTCCPNPFSSTHLLFFFH